MAPSVHSSRIRRAERSLPTITRTGGPFRTGSRCVHVDSDVGLRSCRNREAVLQSHHHRFLAGAWMDAGASDPENAVYAFSCPATCVQPTPASGLLQLSLSVGLYLVTIVMVETPRHRVVANHRSDRTTPPALLLCALDVDDARDWLDRHPLAVQPARTSTAPARRTPDRARAGHGTPPRGSCANSPKYGRRRDCRGTD